MNKAKIISELENMVVARLFGRQPWLADRETYSAVKRKLIQMGLVEVVSVEPQIWRATPLGKELDVDLFQVFMGIIYEWTITSSTRQRPTLCTHAWKRAMRNPL
jgi:hypothetical protein